jgi:hypothetical protein
MFPTIMGRLLSFMLTFGWLCHGIPVLACGGFFPSNSEFEVSMDSQRALAVWSDSKISMHVQVSSSGSSEDFAWVLPIPSMPEVSVGDPGIFDVLDDLTHPELLYPEEKDSGSEYTGACGGSKAMDGAGGAMNALSDDVEYRGGGRVGDYEYDVLATSTVTAMTTWLSDHGYVVPEGAEEVLQPYVDRGMKFLWARLAVDVDVDSIHSLDPLVVTVDEPPDGRLIYPLSISRLSSQAFTPILIYLLGEHRFRIENYGSTDVAHIAEEVGQALADDDWDLANYGSAVDRLTELAGGRLFVTDYARDLRSLSVDSELEALMTEDAYYLTRFYARVPDHSLDDVIIAVGLDDTESSQIADVPQIKKIQEAWGGAALFLSLLLSLGILSSRRKMADKP